MIAKIERKWKCAAKDHTESGKPNAAWVNCPNFKVASSLSAKIRHGSWGKRFSRLKADNLAYLCNQSNKSCTKT